MNKIYKLLKKIKKSTNTRVSILLEIGCLLLRFIGIKKTFTKTPSNSSLNTISTNKLQIILNQLKAKKLPIKLHLGCGNMYKEGWINIDAASDEFPGGFSSDSKVDIEYDLIKPLPVEDNSIDFIFHDNFFEHLPFEDGLNLLKEHYRSLKVGGVVRINQPDLERCIQYYINNNFADIVIRGRSYREHYDLDTDNPSSNLYCSMLRNRTESLNYIFRQFGQHKFLYDYEEVKLRLIEAGFSAINITRSKPNISHFKELCNLEHHLEIEDNYYSLVVEAIK